MIINGKRVNMRDYYTYPDRIDGVYKCRICGIPVRSVSGRKSHLMGPHGRIFGIENEEEPKFNPIRSNNRTKREKSHEVLSEWYSSQEWSRTNLIIKRERND